MNDIFHKKQHAHHDCIQRAHENAERVAEKLGKKFGAHQLRILDVLLEDHKALNAYEIVEKVAKFADRLQPVQVYRALEVLETMGLVHKVRSKNAYIACSNFDNCVAPQLLYCSSCEQIAEIFDNSISKTLSNVASKNSFKLSEGVVELVGLCPRCTNAET